VGALAGAALAAGGARAADLAEDQAVEQLRGLSIEELANVQVTTVSRREESLAQAPAATYVITREEIVRTGARTLPEILRLAPNLFVAQTSASDWVITARGMSGNLSDQAFSNKLLVLIDGRTVYTPVFSGVYWDMQDVLTSDIDHVEVISGPGATLWGANAVNGVINIITRKADQTQGLSLAVGGGDQEELAVLRYGGALGEQASYRLYARAYRADNTLTSDGAEAHDRWSRLLTGFRVDWAPTERDAVSFHGDAFNGSGVTSGGIGGGNLTARWTHAAENGSSLQVQAYVDREQRGHDLTGGLPLWVNTYDIDVQHAFSLGRNDVVLGGGVRQADYSLQTDGGLGFSPSKGTLNLANLFAQDTVTLAPTLRLILGLKFESDPYSRWSALPNARLSWTPDAATMVWAAVSQAIRAPTPFDRDVVETVGGRLFLTGGATFQPEKLTAYEAGVRLRPSPRLSFSASAYYNVYDQLRSVEITPVTFLPIMWGNGIRGHTQGLEAWGNYQAANWWRLSASVNLLSERFEFKPGSSGILGVAQVGDDPKVQAQLKSSMDLGPAVTWDAVLHSRLGWNLTSELQVAIIGYNLLHDHHQEFMAPQANAVPRSVFAELRWRF
jgi:iron complex outermembrane receptor protein